MNRKLVITLIIIALIILAGFYVNKTRDSTSDTNSGNQDSIDSGISNSISDLDSSGNIDSDLGIDQDFDYNIQ